MPPLTNPDDSTPSKSRFVTNYFKNNGTEFVLEIRSAYEGIGTRRIGELTLWKNAEGALTVIAAEQKDE